MNINQEKKKLEKIKASLEDKKEEIRDAEAERKMLFKKLKDDFNLNSIEEVNTFLEELEEEQEKLEVSFDKQFRSLVTELKEKGIV